MARMLKPIGTIQTSYKEKFGIPRQAGLAGNIARITFEPEYDDENAFRGIEGFSHIWLLWEFSENKGEWRPTVRPPKLGGNARLGVFATRSPYHPGSIGLSCVELLRAGKINGRMFLEVRGADLLDGTPIYDIKPYVPYADCHPEATSGWLDSASLQKAEVSLSDDCVLPESITEEKLNEILEVLSLDPRPGYHDDEDRTYGMAYDMFNVEFKTTAGATKVTAITETQKGTDR